MPTTLPASRFRVAPTVRRRVAREPFPGRGRLIDVRRPLLLLVLAALLAGCGDLASGRPGASASASPSPTGSAPAVTATTDCLELAKVAPVIPPELSVTDLGDGSKRVTSAEGGYAIAVPSAWLVTASLSGGIEPQFAQAHTSSFDPRTAPTPRPEAPGMPRPEVGISLNLELWWNPDHVAPERYARDVRIGPDQVAVLPGTAVTVAGRAAYRFTIQDETRFQPNDGPLIVTRQTRAIWLVPKSIDDRMLVIAATPAESSLLPTVERAVATLAIAPAMRAARPVTTQRSDIRKQWLLDKSGNAIPGRRVEAKLMTYTEASAAMYTSHVVDPSGATNAPTGGGPGSRAIPRMDHDPDALYWVVVVSGPDLPQGRGGPYGAPSPAPTAWIFYDTPATSESGSGTGMQYAGASSTTPAWPFGFDTLPDRCR
jgi:hypothetical protein